VQVKYTPEQQFTQFLYAVQYTNCFISLLAERLKILSIEKYKTQLHSLTFLKTSDGPSRLN